VARDGSFPWLTAGEALLPYREIIYFWRRH
jgi:hypothetical protein